MTKGWEVGGKNRESCLMGTVSVWDDEKVLDMGSGGGCPTL